MAVARGAAAGSDRNGDSIGHRQSMSAPFHRASIARPRSFGVVRGHPHTSLDQGSRIYALVRRALIYVAKVAPQGPFELVMGGTASVGRSSAAYPAVAYGLVARGLPVRLPFVYAVGADASRASTGDLLVVRVDISTQRPTVQVEQPRGNPTRKSAGLP